MADIAEKISAAKREAEAIKERIKQKKDALADKTCKLIIWFLICDRNGINNI